MIPIQVLQRVSGNPVQVDQFEQPVVWDSDYKSWTESGNILLIAPASADMIGKLANGILDDYLSTNTISFEGPKFIAMNMSPMIFRNAAVQRNIRQLKDDGYRFITDREHPDSSRMPSVEQIVEEITTFIKMN